LGTSGITGGISYLKGIGDGTFQEAVYYNAQGRPVSIAISDIDGDGKLDVVAVISLSPYPSC